MSRRANAAYALLLLLALIWAPELRSAVQAGVVSMFSRSGDAQVLDGTLAAVDLLAIAWCVALSALGTVRLKAAAKDQIYFGVLGLIFSTIWAAWVLVNAQDLVTVAVATTEKTIPEQQALLHPRTSQLFMPIWVLVLGFKLKSFWDVLTEELAEGLERKILGKAPKARGWRHLRDRVENEISTLEMEQRIGRNVLAELDQRGAGTPTVRDATAALLMALASKLKSKRMGL